MIRDICFLSLRPSMMGLGSSDVGYEGGVAGGVGAPEIDNIATAGDKETYRGFIYLRCCGLRNSCGIIELGWPRQLASLGI